MRKDLGPKSYIYPMPVLIIGTYCEDGTPDAMNAAWGGISGNYEISIYISPWRKTLKNILNRGEFTVSMADGAHVTEADYVGIVSANDTPDKFEKSGFHATKSQHVDAPLIDELAMTLECRKISYDEETCKLVGEIVNVSADNSILNEKGEIDPIKLDPITFDSVGNLYFHSNEIAGYAFKDGKKLK
ncbi:flavin reductase family protein [Blautia liquoris]|uniref:Flavin reductase family protein n=1 Tax=Blautia liquoris TaxID=2779518 RepID=A0A7M2RE61_9FIRM|nr:flavin reductase family protein [Blautia liquoris]QOV18428.1 flavin reductase family protein [Blautia liquoris]